MNHLMQSLLEKDGLNCDTVITAYHISNDRHGKPQRKCDDFVMVDITKLGNEYQLKLRQLIGAGSVVVPATDIVALDGMDPARYVDIYDINPDGSTKKVGKKRGRKPKDHFI